MIMIGTDVHSLDGDKWRATNFISQVAMTYSVELFICMVIGLVAGHAFFNSGP